MLPPTLEKAVEWAKQHVAGLEVAADCEARIQKSYEPEFIVWDAVPWPQMKPYDLDNAANIKLNAMVRNSLDARAAEGRFRKEMGFIQLLIDAADKS